MKLRVNGRIFDVAADPATPLLWILREQLGLTGTKYGCDSGQCGACSIHLNGNLVRACQVTLATIKPGDRIATIEGLSPSVAHPVQKAWDALNVPQCGYCQSGQIMAAVALLKQSPEPTDADIDAFMTNVCRCGTYGRIRAAIKQAAAEIASRNTRSKRG
ncbi:MAG: (2Fe-2S)-binding protein [Hyphomicrobiaceae bacterium]